MFRDESERVVQKMRGTDLHSTRHVKNMPASMHDAATSLVNHSLCHAIEDEALLIFFKYYNTVRRQKSAKDPEAELLKFYTRGPHGNLVLDAATTVGLAALSNAKEDTNLMVRARRKYGAVVHATSKVLKDSGSGTIESAFMIAMLLGLFEV